MRAGGVGGHGRKPRLRREFNPRQPGSANRPGAAWNSGAIVEATAARVFAGLSLMWPDPPGGVLPARIPRPSRVVDGGPRSSRAPSIRLPGDYLGYL